MVGASKILTVSYGTFSCTLEGFDDPFNTMKAIAEYFRDLAAEDRYFGAEPPTPDAAMLHRIAEREIQRRVEAKIQENGVILRAAETEAPRPAAISAPAETPAAPAPVVAEVAAPSPEVAPAEPAAVAETPAEQPVESVAAKLSRIRKAVAESRLPAATVAAPVETAPEAPSDADYFEPEYFENEAADDVATLVTEAAETAPAPEADDILELSDLDMADPVETEAFEEEEAYASPEPEADFRAEDALLANLAGLDVTAEVDTSASDEAPALNDEDAALADLLPEEMAEDLAEFPEERAEVNDDSLLATLNATADAEPESAEAETLVVEEQDEAPDEDLDDLLSSLTAPPARAATLAESLNDEDFSAEDDDTPEATAPEAEPETAPETAEDDRDETETGGTASERIQRARARVIRIRRSVPQPVDETEELSEEAPAPVAEAPLSAEAEADLMRELAEVEAEARDDDDEAVAPVLAEPEAPAAEAPREAAPVRPTRPVRPVRPVAPPSRNTIAEGEPEGEAAMSRLIAETNNQMQGAENRRRLSAIAHLKAAVAATVAERRAGAAKPVNETERQDPYREDLSRIVRPGTTPARPEGAPRPSPLVLVSEQRIDRTPAADPAPRPAEVGPIRPRRIAGSAAQALAEEEDEDTLEDEENLFADTRGFAEFAERLGAQDLGALLEAAAAYAACVEGRPQFTRPQIMRQVASLSETEGNLREDSLRSFGTLLRTGRIVKIRRGQYALAEDSHYLAEARKLVG